MSAESYIRPDLCAACGGSCCKFCAGAAWPADFAEPVAESLREALASGKWALELWEDDVDGMQSPYWVRPRHKGEPVVEERSWLGGECVFLTPTGCEMGPEQRPWACCQLEPREDGECVDHTSPDGLSAKKMACRAWAPHQEMLRALAEEWI